MFLSNEDSFACDGEAIGLSSMSPNNMTLELLYSAFAESASDNRLVQGPADCIDLLSRNPNKVLVCLLSVEESESEKNVNLCIQHILIESICQEYDIPVVKVDKKQIEEVLLNSMMNAFYGKSKSLSQKASAFVSELDCCFIQSKGNNLSASEKKLMTLIHDMQDDRNERLYSDYPK